jgi:hypothetical protein
MDSHIGPDHARRHVHFLLVSQAEWDAFWSHADKHDRERERETLPQSQYSGY